MFLKKEIHLPEESERNFTVRQHKIMYGVGMLIIGAGILFLVLEIRYHLSMIPLWIYAVILAVFLLGILVCLEVKNRQLAVCKNCLYYSNIFGMVRYFTTEDIGSAKAAFNPSGGRDDLRIYDRNGKVLCRLACSMQNADRMICFLHDNGIGITMEKNTRQELKELVLQETIGAGELQRLFQEIYGQAEALIEEWIEKNRKLGAELVYGFAEYYGKRMDMEAQIQPKESRMERKQGGLPEDYLCVLEMYVKKDGCFVRDRKKQFLLMRFPVFYKRKAVTAAGEIRLYYNRSWKTSLEHTLQSLVRYLPGHRFLMEEMELGYELLRKV